MSGQRYVIKGGNGVARGAEPVLRCLGDIEPREVDWLWPGRVPLGRITLLVGRPGEGKSFLSIDMAARVGTGSPWPDGSDCPQGSVILISAEDDPADTIRPRLDAHHADPSCIHLLSAVRRPGDDGQPVEVFFTLRDVHSLEAALESVSDCRLIIIDPIGSFLGGKIDSHRDNEVRGVLAPVAQIAERHGAAVLVVSHRRKSGGTVADDLALGSRAFTGIARAVWHLSRDPGNKGRRLLLPGKLNLSADQGGLAFTIGGEPPRIWWDHAPIEQTADDALAAENEGRSKPGPDPEVRDAATEWLAELLQGGPVPVSEIRAEAELAGYSWRTAQRASKTLGVKSQRVDFQGGYAWSLACQVPQEGNNLASWHTRAGGPENADSACQVPASDASVPSCQVTEEPGTLDDDVVDEPADYVPSWCRNE
jgi:putative DNA primase/helicase